MNQNLEMNSENMPARNGGVEAAEPRGRGSHQLDRSEQEERETFNMWMPASRKRNIRIAANYRQMSPSDYVWDIIRGTVSRDIQEMMADLSSDPTIAEDSRLPAPD